MKISLDLIPTAYQISKEVFEKKIPLSQVWLNLLAMGE